MPDQERASEDVDREAWLGRINRAELRAAKPRDIVAACRHLSTERDAHLRGQLLDHLDRLATGYLSIRVDKQLPNEGQDAVREVVGNMVTSIIDPDAADGRGFESSFFEKLEHRLIDHVRRWRRETAVVTPQESDEESGYVVERPDGSGLSPEDIAMAEGIIAALPVSYRKAFLLHRAGFSYESQNPDESIALMLGKTPKTARKWVEKAEALILQQLGIRK